MNDDITKDSNDKSTYSNTKGAEILPKFIPENIADALFQDALVKYKDALDRLKDK